MIANIAHAGDGNLHPLIIAPVGDDAAKERAKAAFDRIVADCLDLGGTVTGEHGVGLLKLAGVERELGPRVVQMHRAIKDALDPQGILNPGKAFPAAGSPVTPGAAALTGRYICSSRKGRMIPCASSKHFSAKTSFSTPASTPNTRGTELAL